MNIELTRNPDILAALGKDKKPGQLLCGFAMETQNLLDNAESKLRRKNCDMLVANCCAIRVRASARIPMWLPCCSRTDTERLRR